MTSAIVNKILHAPLSVLKEIARQEDGESAAEVAEVVHRLFALDGQDEVDAPTSRRPYERASHGDGGMGTMRIAAITMVGALAVSTSAIAQGTDTSTTARIAQYSTDKLASELSLTPDQVPKVQKINVGSVKVMQDLIAKYGPDTSLAATKALARGMVTEIRANQSELKKILTPTQWTLHQQHKAERLAMSQTEIMASDLNLTRQQILDVSRINLESANKLVVALDKPMGTAKPTSEALLAAAKPVIDARDEQLHKVLTVDQFEKVMLKRLVLHDVLLAEATSRATPAPAAAAPRPNP